MRADATPENSTEAFYSNGDGTAPLNEKPPREPQVAEPDGGRATGLTATTAQTVRAAMASSGLRETSDESEIHHYAQAGNVDRVRRCLLLGLNKVDEVDELGCTAVHLAGAMGHADVVRLLIEQHGASVDARDGALCTALHAASEGGHPVVVELLLRFGAEIDARNGKGQTPLHYACGYGQVDAAQQLTLRGASTGARDIQGNTPLHLACSGGEADIVRLLLVNGSPLQAVNHRGRRPLHLACRSGYLDIAIALLENGADPSSRDANGMQAIDMIGVKRQISKEVRSNFLHTLERYILGDFASARAPLSSAKSLRQVQVWRGRDDVARVSFAASEAPMGVRANSSLARGVTAPYDGFSTVAGGGGVKEGKLGGFGGRVGAPRGSGDGRSEGFRAAGELERGKLGVEEVGGRSPRWSVGTAVAGRLEEMRARELGASLRAKVQENEAMKRHLDSVKEEMRMLQRKVLEQSSARSYAHEVGEASADVGVDPGLRGSIAEQVAHTMHGMEGIGGHSIQGVGMEDEDVARVRRGTRSGPNAYESGRSKASLSVSPHPPTAVTMAAPSHGNTEAFHGSGLVGGGRRSSTEAAASGGGCSADRPSGVEAWPLSMSQLLMAKRAQLQSLLDMHQPGRA